MCCQGEFTYAWCHCHGETLSHLAKAFWKAHDKTRMVVRPTNYLEVSSYFWPCYWVPAAKRIRLVRVD